MVAARCRCRTACGYRPARTPASRAPGCHVFSTYISDRTEPLVVRIGGSEGVGHRSPLPRPRPFDEVPASPSTLAENAKLRARPPARSRSSGQSSTSNSVGRRLRRQPLRADRQDGRRTAAADSSWPSDFQSCVASMTALAPVVSGRRPATRDRCRSRRQAANRELPALVGHGEILRVDRHDVRRHVRMDVAEQPAQARPCRT